MVEETENGGDVVGSVADVLVELGSEAAIPGVPAPVKRNLLKALGQLCSAAIDWPIAYLTGKGDERRAETAARVKLIETSAEQIAEQMATDPEYAQVAVRKFGQRVLREQVNLDQISLHAVDEVLNDSDGNDLASVHEVDENPGDVADASIDDDWLNAFEVEARQKSTNDMRRLFGKVLAGEIKRPGTFSPLTVRTLSSLDTVVAEKFVTLCSLSISILGKLRVASLGGNAADNALQEFGLNFEALNLLNEHGLVIADFNSWQEFLTCLTIPQSPTQIVLIPFEHQRRTWILVPESADQIGQRMRISGVSLTHVGNELSKIVEIDWTGEYTRKLTGFFARNGYRMTENTDNNPRIAFRDSVTGLPIIEA